VHRQQACDLTSHIYSMTVDFDFGIEVHGQTNYKASGRKELAKRDMIRWNSWASAGCSVRESYGYVEFLFFATW
jgi:hypothetical protein